MEGEEDSWDPFWTELPGVRSESRHPLDTARQGQAAAAAAVLSGQLPIAQAEQVRPTAHATPVGPVPPGFPTAQAIPIPMTAASAIAPASRAAEPGPEAEVAAAAAAEAEEEAEEEEEDDDDDEEEDGEEKEELEEEAASSRKRRRHSHIRTDLDESGPRKMESRIDKIKAFVAGLPRPQDGARPASPPAAAPAGAAPSDAADADAGQRRRRRRG